MVVEMLVWGDVVIALLVLWATTGLTIIHLAVLAGRFSLQGYRSLRGRRSAESPSPEPEAADPAAASLTFVVPVYNDAITVGSTLESILHQSVRPVRVVAVDDGSTDDTRRVLDAFRSRGVDVIHLPRNMGKTHALEAALATVDTELVAITDADSIVHHDYVKHVTRALADPELAAVGGAVESIPHTWVTATRQIEYMVTVQIDRNAETSMDALVVLPGVSSTFRTSVLKEIGFEHDTIAEDFDLTFRLQRAGKKIRMEMEALVYTSDPPTLRAYYQQLVRWYTDFWLVIKKHRAVLGERVFGTVEVPMLVLNATVASLLFLVLPLYLVLMRPERLLWFFASAFAMDLLLVVIAWRAYRRPDMWWALVSRVPTRFISRCAFLYAMVRVLAGRPGRAWAKLERRPTSAFLDRQAKLAAATLGGAGADRAMR